jgi:hypothetical protein
MTDKTQDQVDGDQVRQAFRLPTFLTTTRGAAVVAILALGLALAGCLTPLVINEMHRQAAIDQVVQHGHHVTNFIMPRRFGFFSRWLPVINTVPVVGVHLGAATYHAGATPDLSDFDFKSLVYFPELRDLSIERPVSEGQLLALPAVDNLKELKLVTDQATDAVVRHAVASYPTLTSLSLDSDSLTDASIAQICRLEKLEHLYLNAPQIHGTAIEPLRTLKHLREVIVDPDMKQVTPAELEEIKRFLPVGRASAPTRHFRHLSRLRGSRVISSP